MKIDWDLLKIIINQEKIDFRELVEKSKKSRVSVYHSLKELERLSFIRREGNFIILQKNPLTAAAAILIIENFPLEYLKSRGIDMLVYLLKERTVNEISRGLNISFSSTYHNLRELSPLVAKKNKKYRINEKNKNLLEFLTLLKKQIEIQTKYVIVWSEGSEKLIKAPMDEKLPGASTAFSCFSQFGVKYIPLYNYYYLPKSDLTLEEIFVHSLLCAEDKHMLAISVIFYLKNRDVMDINKIRSESRRLNVQDIWLDVQNYLEGAEVKRSDLFLPENEFTEKSRMYGAYCLPKYPKETWLEVLDEIAQRIKKETTIYLIGGGALILGGIKGTTKDIDLVLDSKEDFDLVKNVLESIGFKGVGDVSQGYKQLQASTIMDRGNSPRIDLFTKKVCGIFLSDEMKKRSIAYKEIGNLKIMRVSAADILLFKALSSREGDIVDCERILSKKKVDWDVVLKEYIDQEKLSDAFLGFVFLDNIEILESRLGAIPIRKKILNICLERAILDMVEKPRTVSEIKKFVDFPEYGIRNALNRLVKQNRIIKRMDEKPIRFLKK